MKFKLLLAIIISCLSFQLQASSRDDLEGEFKGNWTRVFQLTNGNFLTHRPDGIWFNDTLYQDNIVISKDSADGMIPPLRLTEGELHLLTDSTEEEFEKALKESGASE